MLQSHIERYYGALRLLLPSFAASECIGRSGCRLAPKKKEAPMSITGTVKFFNADKGYGFIAPDTGGNDAFVHISAVERAGMVTLNQNQKVSYDLEEDRRGKTSAVNLQPAD
jgi:CspA family cold shock protein